MISIFLHKRINQTQKLNFRDITAKFDYDGIEFVVAHLEDSGQEVTIDDRISGNILKTMNGIPGALRVGQETLSGLVREDSLLGVESWIKNLAVWVASRSISGRKKLIQANLLRDLCGELEVVVDSFLEALIRFVG